MLLVEDDAALSDAIGLAARGWTMKLHPYADGLSDVPVVDFVTANVLEEGIMRLRTEVFDLVLTDVALGDKCGLALVEYARKLEPAPVVVAISGEATAAQAFALSELGVRGYLAKPFDLHELRATIQAVLSQPPEVEFRAMAQVGFRHIHAVQDEVKLAMLKRALQQESWNITRAAKRLGVTRTAVQQMIDRYELPRTKGNPTHG
jgi:DNA-binding NtrC family response regulator